MSIRKELTAQLSAFIALEIVAFPLSVGLYINLAAVPLFPGMTVGDRLRAFKEGQFGTLFVYWMVGTM